jgi:hypothetical protein
MDMLSRVRRGQDMALPVTYEDEPGIWLCLARVRKEKDTVWLCVGGDGLSVTVWHAW